MSKTRFLINNRFFVDPDLKYFQDKELLTEQRLEPRLINVLCVLTSRANQLVTRGELVKEIWNDYGGGDEALNQAISFLRKLLHDHNKEIIETIPKKGYILHGDVSNIVEPEILEDTGAVKKWSKKKIYWLSGLLFFLILISCFIYWDTFNNETHNSDKLDITKKSKGADVLVDTNIKPGSDILGPQQTSLDSGKSADVLR
jgi:DNA-binding winged helix-turn-helix (wHTH) protein